MFWVVIASFVVLIIGYQLVAEVASRYEDKRWSQKTAEYHAAVALQSSVKASAESVDRNRDSHAEFISVETSTSQPTKDLGYQHHPDRWKGWRTVAVQSVRDESPDCRSFAFVPIDGKPFPPFAGGQSLLVRATNPVTQKPVSRCYSLSSGPDEKHYRITVKRVPGGVFSNLLHDHIKAGDQIELQAPRGKFYSVPAHTEPLNLIAAGIGITPMLSMLLHCLGEHSSREINLFYQLRDSTNAPFLAPIRQLAQALSVGSESGSPGFRLHVWFSKPSTEDAQQAVEQHSVEMGRIDATRLLAQLGHHNGQFMICGPELFMSGLAADLVECGVDESKVSYESFGGKAKGPGAIFVAGDAASDATDRSFDVRFRSSGKSGKWTSKMDGVLDLAEHLDIPVDSGCREGNCGACILSLTKGTVEYDQEPECDVEPGECVACIARPTSDLEIDA